MKKLIAILALMPALCFGAANDIRVTQTNSDNTGLAPTRLVPPPPGGANGIMGFNGSTVLPIHWTIGSGLTLAGGVLDAVPGGAPSWTSITDKPSTVAGYGITDAFSGSYGALTGIPLAFAPSPHTHAAADIVSGTISVARIPAIPISQTTGLQTALDAKFNTPAGTLGQYVRGDGSLMAFPALFSGAYSDLTGIPSTFAPAAHTQSFSTITGAPTTLSGYGITDGAATARSAISLTTTGTSGAATYNSATGALNVPNYTVQLPPSINDAPGRALVTATSATGYQISATRISEVCYEGTFLTTSTIGGPSGATVFLETSDTNSTTPSDWTIKAQQNYSNTITLAVVLNQAQANNWSMCRHIPAGKYVRLRSGSITGTASVTINTSQQETLL